LLFCNPDAEAAIVTTSSGEFITEGEMLNMFKAAYALFMKVKNEQTNKTKQSFLNI